MSMWLEYVKVTPKTLEVLKKDPELLDAIFFEEDDDRKPQDINDDDLAGLDWRTLAAIAEAMTGVELTEQDTWTAKASGVDFGTLIDFEFCYGPAFMFTIEEVKQIAQGLQEEGWDPEDEYDENIGRFFAMAEKEGKGVIGGVN